MRRSPSIIHLYIRKLVERYRIGSPDSEIDSLIFSHRGVSPDVPEQVQNTGILEP
jgi:hypothetical protein